MKLAIDRLIEAIAATGNPTCAGLDTRVSHVPDEIAVEPLREGLPAQAIAAYNMEMINVLAGIVPAVKVQIAYYEMLGIEGMCAFEATMEAARDAGMIVIVDAKRNDIGATSEAYADAYVSPQAPFAADFLTINPYLGSDGVLPFVNACKKSGSGLFCLVKTSNASSGEIQDLLIDGQPLYARVGELVKGWGDGTIGEHGYAGVGAVVGATYPEQGRELRRRLPGVFFLIPGYGAQGATATDLAGCFDESGRGGIVNASRSLLTAWQKAPGTPWRTALKDEALRMRDELAAAISGSADR